MVLIEKSTCFRRSLSLVAAGLRARGAWKLFDVMLSPAPRYCTQTLTPIDTFPTPDVYCNNRRINHLIQSGLLIRARQLFDEMRCRDVVSWNSMIAGYARANSSQQAMLLFKEMLASGNKETPHTFSSLFGACSLLQGLQLHCRAISLGFDSNLFVGSALVDLYMRTGSTDLALRLFRLLPQRSTVACNSVLRGFCELQFTDELLSFFHQEMRSGNGVEPDGVSFSYLIRGCCGGQWLDEGKQLHCLVIKAGWVSANLFVSNALVDLYSAAGELIDARRLIDCIPVEDVISWNSIVSVCADNGSSIESLAFFHRMLQQGKRPSIRAFVGLVNLCSRSQNILLGAQIHGFVRKMGFSCSSIHLQTAMIDMYGKCLDIESSVLFFSELAELTLECCNSLITAFLHCNLLEDTIEMFGLMIDEGVRPDHITFSSALKALSSSSAASTSLSRCQILHCCAVKSGVESNKMVSCSLINAYSRSGNIDLSRLIFERIEDPKVICFTAIIAAYARNGMGREGVEMLGEMILRGLRPDGVTFLCALAGCDHSGLVDEARSVFESMTGIDGVVPDRRHYSCMVNLLGRAGLVEEAMELARAHGDPTMWSSVLQGCRVHGNEEVGRRAAEELMKLQPGAAAACLQVSGFYSEIEDMDRSVRLRAMMSDLVGREIGCSLVEVEAWSL